MDKFLMKRFVFDKYSANQEENASCKEGESSEVPINIEVDLANLPTDPALRLPIYNYHPNIQDSVRKAYLLQDLYQPRNCVFQRNHQKRKFNPAWFDEYKDWLEYSPTKHKAYCRYCYLFKPKHTNKFNTEAFVSKGFDNWKEKKRLDKHVGGPNSFHNLARIKCEALKQQMQHLVTIFNKQNDEYKIHLWAIIAMRYLLRQGLALSAHDEESLSEGIFIDLLKLFAKFSNEINDGVLKNALENNKLIYPDIHKDIIKAVAMETRNAIVDELGDTFFSILLDSRDASTEEQMAIVLRFVNEEGQVVERFLALICVLETNAVSLKASIEDAFSKHGLSISNLRGQGYNETSSMRGAFNGLKTLILNENESAFYINCFAHQLQLALVAAFRTHWLLDMFFSTLEELSNFFTTLCGRLELVQEVELMEIAKALELGELKIGQGLNEEISFKQPGYTQGSHYVALINLLNMYSSVIKVLEYFADNTISGKRINAVLLLQRLQGFEFVFCLHLMFRVLGLTNELSEALHENDQKVVHVMSLVAASKQGLQNMRDNGWDSLVNEISIFCKKFDILIPDLEDLCTVKGQPRRVADRITCLRRYCDEVFYTIIDLQLQELNAHLTESNVEFLISVACLSPKHSFSTFDKDKLVHLAHLYPKDFCGADLDKLEKQLDEYIIEMKNNVKFSSLNSLAELAEMMVATQKHEEFPLVYLLIRLTLTLPVATTSVVKAFSVMCNINTRLDNEIGDELISDALVTYVEKDICDAISNEAIMNYFQNMKSRRCQLHC
ncbi:uncharacterized protein LOC116247624 [Nymphaea colorata]|uniref:uncharacterized protein LOC116247624 n=1 Tax=Nymphaea colorata TaxID=210225 RepID=UPI00129D7FB1|nr:uncharacterized protein LOC116247624 [Nymphaea colorata]XP_049931920.1 uncharacterized protein LOC116247624 [Nymphaea colorata]